MPSGATTLRSWLTSSARRPGSFGRSATVTTTGERASPRWTSSVTEAPIGRA